MLAPMVKRAPGLRVPGCWDGFELAIRAIIGQQISVKGASTLLGRLVEAFGEELDISGNDVPGRLFPAPADIARHDLRQIGLTKARARTLAALTEASMSDPDFIHPALDASDARARLLAIPGIGPCTADYIALRALRDADAFPAADLGLLKASGAEDAAALETRAEAWRPWRGYAALHLWNSLK